MKKEINQNSEKEIKIKNWISKIPKRYKKFYVKAREGSLRMAINSKCLDCVCWQPEEIEKCPCINCPLWEIRPYQK